MKIALELKEENRDKIIDNLIKHDYDIDTRNLGCIWIYGIKNIHNPYNSKGLTLEIGKMTSVTIDLDDIKYFEIHCQKDTYVDNNR